MAVFNGGDTPANIDVSNFTGTVAGVTFGAFTKDELIQRAENRAAWTQVGLALLGGVAAAAAASQNDTYRTTLYTPRGVYSAVTTGPSSIGQVQAAASIAGASVGIARVQDELDRKREMLANEVLQTTTVDPGTGHGGQVMLHKFKMKKLPQTLRLSVSWNGEDYPFEF